MVAPVQRYPNGILQTLGLVGVSPPNVFADAYTGVVDMLQYFARSQYQRLVATDAALAEGGLVTLTVPQSQYWILLHAEFNVQKTGTMTALQTSITIGPNVNERIAVASQEFVAFGATVTGSAKVILLPPQPIILAPGWVVSSRLDILGTDANASTAMSVGVGVCT